MNQEKERQNTRFLLFADLSVPPEKALLYLNDMEQNPHKITKYNQLLMQNLSRQESVKDKSGSRQRHHSEYYQRIYY